MTKNDFTEFYDAVIKKLGTRFANQYENIIFSDAPESLYEEYMNQRTMIKTLYEKGEGLLDRHKVCACMAVAIIKLRLLSSELDSDRYKIASASRVNEQFAFICSWELFKGFVALHSDGCSNTLELPKTYHNASFLDTITRSLFYANQMNSLSVPLIANIFFLLERYCEESAKNKH